MQKYFLIDINMTTVHNSMVITMFDSKWIICQEDLAKHMEIWLDEQKLEASSRHQL